MIFNCQINMRFKLEIEHLSNLRSFDLILFGLRNVGYDVGQLHTKKFKEHSFLTGKVKNIMSSVT